MIKRQITDGLKCRIVDKDSGYIVDSTKKSYCIPLRIECIVFSLILSMDRVVD
jgi:hypothetical protein